MVVHPLPYSASPSPHPLAPLNLSPRLAPLHLPRPFVACVAIDGHLSMHIFDPVKCLYALTHHLVATPVILLPRRHVCIQHIIVSIQQNDKIGNNTINKILSVCCIDTMICWMQTRLLGDGNADFLSALFQLEVVDLARAYVILPHLEVLGKLNLPRQLDLGQTAIQGSTLQAVSPALTGLEQLDVSYTPAVSRTPCCCS